MRKTNKKLVKRKIRKNTRKKTARKTKRKTNHKKPKKSVKKTSKGLFGKTVNKIETKGEIGKFLLPLNGKYYKIPKEIIVDDKRFIYGKELGFGTFGNTYSYKGKTQEIAVKIGIVDMDIKAGKKINAGEKKKICYPQVVSYQNTRNLFIMEKMDGDLIQYISRKRKKIPSKDIHEIINVMSKTIQCLLKMGIYYTDIKAQNTLYRKKGKKLSIYLGDLGGGEPENGMYYITTYDPFDKRKIGIGQPTEKDLSWMIGILTMQLLNEDVYPFHWSQIKNMTNIEFLVRKNKLLKKYKKNKKIHTLLKGTLTSNPKDRFTLDQIIQLSVEH